MCKIEEVKSYRINDKLYPTKEAAVSAALSDIADVLKKNHASNPLPGIIQHADDLVYLLTEYRALNPLPSAPKERFSADQTTLSDEGID
jgi:hypothetical protein